MNSPSRSVTNSETGLSAAQAADRLAREGYNELPSARPRDVLHIALEVLREPMFLLLVAAGSIYLLLGDLREALVLLASVFVVMGITVYQERKTERTLEALRDLSSPRALVIRDRKRQRIAGREVVRGDILLLHEGDRVPADAVLLGCSDLKADESLLTGESVPVRKAVWDGSRQMERPGGDDMPFVYSGTVLVQGQGSAEVLATGAATQMGKIGRALQEISAEPHPLQRETSRIVRTVAVLAALLCIVVVVLYGLTRHDWLAGFLAGVTLAMALLPEEFPVVLTVFLALGAWRISKQQVLTRRVAAIETLGAATVLCVDKTGTLTLNRMAVKKLYAQGRTCDIEAQTPQALPSVFDELVEYAILASEVDPFDPMDKAFLQVGERFFAGAQRRHPDWKLVHEYALAPSLLAHSHGWREAQGDAQVVASKGAPEAIADLCHLSAHQIVAMEREVQLFAGQGLRVLGVAKAVLQGSQWPPHQHDFDFKFLGLVGLADPVRPTVKAALAECYAAGLRVMMITGDYPGTAQAIAAQIGLRGANEALSGPELDGLPEERLRERVRNVDIFARVVPEQKLRLVNALKSNGEIVAMTGDGVNDAPALKAAHIGIAMGGRGTDVAREAASLVLLDDDFASIVHTIKLGRRIYDNIQNAMCYIIAVHVPTAGISVLPLLLGWPLVLFPVHIVFLEFVIDPACSIAFEAEPGDPDVMQRSPRRADQRLFSRRTVVLSVLQGLSVLAAVIAVYALALRSGAAAPEARAMTFATIVFGNLWLILSNRSHAQPLWVSLRAPNPALWWVIAGTLVALAATLYVPVLSALFRFSPPGAVALLQCLLAPLLTLAWFEVYKVMRRTTAPVATAT